MSVLGRVAEFQNVMADLYLQQAEVSKYWALIGPDIKWLQYLFLIGPGVIDWLEYLSLIGSDVEY